MCGSWTCHHRHIRWHIKSGATSPGSTTQPHPAASIPKPCILKPSEQIVSLNSQWTVKQRLVQNVCHLACVSSLIWFDCLWSLLGGALCHKNTIVSSCFKSFSSVLLIVKSHRPHYRTNAAQSGPQGLYCVHVCTGLQVGSCQGIPEWMCISGNFL